MKQFLKFLFCFSLFLSACAGVPAAIDPPARALSSQPLEWRTHGGIETTTIEGRLILVRADPLVAPLELINPPRSAGSVAQLASRLGYSVLINAAMFAKDYVTSIGYMRNFDHVNNPRVSSKLRGFLMFNPKESSHPSVKIGTQSESSAYQTVFQTHRMWSPQEGILWKKGASVYRQVALVGVDSSSRVLFFYHPQMIDMHDLVAGILELDLDLQGLLYLDGGSHGSLYLAPELGRGWNTWISLPNVMGLKASLP